MKTTVEVERRNSDSASDGPVPQLLVRVPDAAQAMGISVDSFERWVEPKVKIVRIGRYKLVPRAELVRFVEEEAYQVGGDW